MLNYLKEEIRKFSDGQFGIRKDAIGPLNHLKEEVDELIDALGKGGIEEEEEWADCLLLLLDAFRIRYGDDVSFNRLLHFSLNKLEVIKQREWDKELDDNGVYHSRK